MFKIYESPVNTIIIFLRLLKVKVNDFTINKLLQNHPDWPSLLCISDSLNKLKIPNAVAKIEPENVDVLPVPFIALMGNNQSPLSIVTTIADDFVELYESDDFKKRSSKKKNEFIKQWSGIYLIAEPNDASGEKDYYKHKQITLFKSFIPTGFFALLVAALLISFFQNVFNSSASFAAFSFQIFILLAGLTIAVALLWYEIDKTNPLLNKVCSGIVKGNCNAILTGKQAKVFSWLSWSEVGFFYFAGGLLTLFISEFSTQAMTLIALLNLAALPYPIFSIYYQWRVAKQWCVLCLAVQALLVLGAANILLNRLWAHVPEFTIDFLLKGLIWYLIPVLLWYAVKPYILKLQEAKNTKREYLRIKFNAEIFETLLKKQKKITAPVEGLGIDLGNKEASNHIVKVCSPYCAPCAKAHNEIESLLEEIPNLNAKIIFRTPNEEESPSIKLTRHLLAIAENVDEFKTKKALDDWYNAEKKDYADFAAKYPMNGELQQQNGRIEEMYDWCNKMKIQFTPSIFVNGYQLPDTYSIKDLKYFLLD